VKALALISGGLDSMLAARFIKQEGIEVVGLRFKIPFFLKERKQVGNLGIEIKEIDICQDFLSILRHPEHGYGANINPCIDCKILMLRKAKELLKEYGAKFIVTGEVLGQRPMSQHKQALAIIAKKAGLEGLVLRPLSAGLLPETIPEKEGWIKRERMLSFSGRSRKPQIELANNFGIQEYAQPAGGCQLTDSEFTKRVKDLIEHNALDIANIELLKFGRHFRFSPSAKLVVGRNELENAKLVHLAEGNDYLFMPGVELAGPTSLGRGIFSEDLIRLSCAITCRYCDLSGAASAGIVYKKLSHNKENIMDIPPVAEEEIVKLRI
jgi:tRNA-specific 2-thiouridylase